MDINGEWGRDAPDLLDASSKFAWEMIDTGPFSPITVEQNRCALFVTVENENGTHENYWLKVVEGFSHYP
jgi:hypothetical protein